MTHAAACRCQSINQRPQPQVLNILLKHVPLFPQAFLMPQLCACSGDGVTDHRLKDIESQTICRCTWVRHVISLQLKSRQDLIGIAAIAGTEGVQRSTEGVQRTSSLRQIALGNRFSLHLDISWESFYSLKSHLFATHLGSYLVVWHSPEFAF